MVYVLVTYKDKKSKQFKFKDLIEMLNWQFKIDCPEITDYDVWTK